MKYFIETCVTLYHIDLTFPMLKAGDSCFYEDGSKARS